MKERILLLGANGQLGRELQRSLQGFAELLAISRADCDLVDTQALQALVRRARPRIIVNAAAYTAVDQAEAEPMQAMALNAQVPAVLADEALRCGAWLLHYSSDYVFDGKSTRPYTEADAAHPLNMYGRSKLAGEWAIQASGVQHLILRSSWILGAHGSNFAKTLLQLATEREHLDVVADQYGAPTSAALLADLSAQLIQQAQTEENFPFGLYHVSAGGETNWHDYACFVIAEAQAAGKTLKLTPEGITAVPSKDYLQAALRPLNSRLNTEKFRSTFGLPLPDWRVGVRDVLQQCFLQESCKSP